MNQLDAIEAQRNEITDKYHEALDLLGEQTERIEELQQDIKEMKVTTLSTLSLQEIVH